ncbi:MAG: ISAs1 family transposase [Planctomycetaceae bacterium]|nr:ISAs1 family transposase [Planctomycetaceae bacterium]
MARYRIVRQIPEGFLKTFLELPGGIPSHDTFRRVFGKLERSQFAVCLFAWTQALREATGGKVIAIDGKALRRTFSKKSGLAMLHLVTAWSSENRLTLGQVACEEKSNELTAIPELLKLLSLRGTTVTIDAMGCQKEIAAQIRERKGHYLLQVKGNQPKLEEQLVDYFGKCLEADFAGVRHERHETTETGHGRTETRIIDAVSLPADFAMREDWKDLNTLVMVTSQRVVAAQESWESRYNITDHRPRAQFLGHAIRQHWGIENGQHWILDVTFGEDSRRQQDRNGSANLAAVRRLTVSLLQQEKTNRRGVKNKRLQCALDPGYLLKVLASARF